MARHLLVRRAIEFCVATNQQISVSDLAAACGVSKRVLELGFRETLRVPPSRFMRQERMNQVRNELRASDCASTSVTDVLSRWGVTELGRFAVEYKSLFGESPSTTLGRDFVVPNRRLADALVGP
jgi:AraC family ethanolamine operon transcriptional activator